MKRNAFKAAVEQLGYNVTINKPVTPHQKNEHTPVENITICLNKNDYLLLVSIDETKPFTFTAHELFHLIHHSKRRDLYRLIAQYADTLLHDRN